MHELTRTYEIDGKYHVQPSVGLNKGKTLKVFNTEAEANAWAKKRSDMSPKQKKIAGQAAPKNKITGADFKAMREYENKSMLNRLSDAKEGVGMKQMLKKTKGNEKEPVATMYHGMGKKKKKGPKAVMYGGSMKKPKMAVMAHKKKPKAVMYGGSMNASSMRKNKDEPVAAMPGYHMQKRDKY